MNYPNEPAGMTMVDHDLIIVPVLGETHPLPRLLAAILPGCSFRQFSTGRLEGLAKVTGSRLEILAVVAHHPYCGDFGRLLEECMAHYEEVVVWEPSNPHLYAMLVRRGFHQTREYLDGEWNDGLYWRDRSHA